MARNQTCPRRMSGIGPWEAREGLDSWDKRGGIIGQEKIGDGCSFCGSLHPDRFMELVRQGWIVGPTDKGYKAYVGRPLAVAEVAARREAWMGSHPVAVALRTAGERDGNDEAAIQAGLDAEWLERHAPLLAASGQEAKFYYQHLSADQMREFVDLHNAGRLRWGYPGYPYVPPFFMSFHGG